MKGQNASQVARKLERCADVTLKWAERNAVVFETDKTEAILFTKKRNRHREIRTVIRVGPNKVRFSRQAI